MAVVSVVVIAPGRSPELAALAGLGVKGIESGNQCPYSGSAQDDQGPVESGATHVGQAQRESNDHDRCTAPDFLDKGTRLMVATVEVVTGLAPR